MFYVPSESGEKVTLGISALLSMTVFLMTIRESLPPTEKTPLISIKLKVHFSKYLVRYYVGKATIISNFHDLLPQKKKISIFGFIEIQNKGGNSKIMQN